MGSPNWGHTPILCIIDFLDFSDYSRRHVNIMLQYPLSEKKIKGLYLIVRNPINTPAQYSVYSLHVCSLTKISLVFLFNLRMYKLKIWICSDMASGSAKIMSGEEGRRQALCSMKRRTWTCWVFPPMEGKTQTRRFFRREFYVMYLERNPTIWLNHGNRLLITSAKYYYY